MTMIRKTRARAAVLAASGALLLSGCEFSVYDIPLPGGTDVGDDPYEVTVEFRDVLDLVPQSTVKVDDVSVGRVESIELDGYAAKVSLSLRSDVKLPDNAVAEIRQTSLLGEKFVSLAPPANPSSGSLGDGDTIGLDRTGRNTEVEEVLGALSLLLNGGGVGQLKTITEELNTAFDGRESEARSVLNQIRVLMSQLDTGKDEILEAMDRVNQLSKSLNSHTDDLDLALKELPSAIESVDSQRDDLVKMLKALSRLSSVGTRVIAASKQGTIESLNALAPVLTQLARSGDDLAKSLQIVLTYPFIDAVVGKSPQQARDLHMGDYTNLSVQLDLEVGTILDNTPLGGGDGGGDGDGPLPELPGTDVPDLPGLPGSGDSGGSGGGDSGGSDGGVLDGLGGGLGRAAVGRPSSDREVTKEKLGELAGLLAWGVLHR